MDLNESIFVLVSSVSNQHVFHDYADFDFLVKNKLITGKHWVVEGITETPFEKGIIFDNGITLKSTPGRLTVSCDDEKNGDWQAASTLILKVAGHVKSFKLSGLGVNFTLFREESDVGNRITEKLVVPLDIFADSETHLNLKHVCNIKGAISTRTAQIMQAHQLMPTPQPPGLYIGLNYHHDLGSSSEAVAICSNADSYKEHASEFASKVEAALDL